MNKVENYCNSVGIDVRRTYTTAGTIIRFIFSPFTLTPDYICPEKALEDPDSLIYILKRWFNI